MRTIKLGDCVEILKNMENEYVQTIYFDPPFNSDKIYCLTKEDETGFKDKWGKDEKYSEFIEKTIIQLERVLKDKGSLFFHISAKEMFIPFSILKKHFSYVFPIFWKKARSKNNVKNGLGTCVDVIFWCSKTDKPTFYSIYQPLNEKYLEGSYKNKDEKGNYALGHLVNTAPYATKNKDRLYEIEIDGKIFKPVFGWRISKEKLLDLIRENRIHIPKSEKKNLYKKIYLEESNGKPATDLWDDIYALAQGEEKRIYPTQKPEKLLERIILMSSKEGDIVLDPMCGSGTTGAVALKLNRNFILIDSNEDAVNIAINRIKEIIKTVE